MRRGLITSMSCFNLAIEMLFSSGVRLIAAQELPRVSISQSRCLSGQVGYTYLPRVPYYRFNLAIERLFRSGQNDVTVAYFYYQVFQSRHREAFQVRFPRRRDSQLATPIVSISQSRCLSVQRASIAPPVCPVSPCFNLTIEMLVSLGFCSTKSKTFMFW